MFAHQVIEAIETIRQDFLRSPSDDKDANSLRNYFYNMIPVIRKAQHFHMGDVDDIELIFAKDTGSILFGPACKDLRLPYSCTWFDYTFNNVQYSAQVNPGTIPLLNSKEAVLVIRITETVWLSWYYTYARDYRRWFPSTLSAIIMVGGQTSDNVKIAKGLLKIYQITDYHNIDQLHKDAGIIPVYLYPMNPKEQKELLNNHNLNFKLLQCSLKLLTCKNITTEIIKPSIALNKKRIRNNKQPLFEYHILNVIIPAKKRGYHESTIPLAHNRVHLCRGHFKEYTIEHPLFGHLTGRYWWQSHMRGQNKDGVVMKDYIVNSGRQNDHHTQQSMH